MTLTEYAKTHKYMFIFADYRGGYKDGWKINKHLYKIEDYSWPRIKNIRIYGAEIEEKPKLTFEDVENLIHDPFGYGYYKLDDANIVEKVTENQIALDMINSLLANQLVLFPSYISTDELIEITDEELEEYFNIREDR